MSHLKVFECIAFALITSHKPHNFDEKSEKCLFVGNSFESKAYGLFNPVTCKILVNKDVIFHEESRWNWEALQNDQLMAQVDVESDDPMFLEQWL